MKYIKRHYKLIAFCVIVVLILILNQIFGWSAYLRDSDNLAFLSDVIRDNLLVASLIYIGITIIACVILALPGVIFAVLAGTLFGPWLGTLNTLIATTLGAIIAFIVGRFFLRDSIKPMLEKSPKLKKVLFDDAGCSDMALLAITRLVPIFPYNLQNFAYGITDISLSHYSLYTFLFMIPGVALYTVGAAGFTSNNKALCFGIAGGLLIITLLLAWFIRKRISNPKISIVMAVFNGEDDVKKCIKSLRNQTYKNIEIVCVDDGSTDRTLEVLKKQAKEDDRIKIYSQGKNKKLLLAVKRGVKEATGDYIMFVDADDWYEAKACERVCQIINKSHPDIVCFGTNVIDDGNDSTQKIRNRRVKRLKVPNFKYKGKTTLGIDKIKYNYIWNRAVKADVAKKAYDALFDKEMNYQSNCYGCIALHYYAKTLVGISDKLINYNNTSGLSSQTEMSASSFKAMMKDIQLYEEGVSTFLKERNETKELNSFNDKCEKRIMRKINIWHDRVEESESEEALNSIKECYGKDRTERVLEEFYLKQKEQNHK